MHQRDKMGISAVGELARSKDNVLVRELPESVELMNELRDRLKYFEHNPTNLKTMI